MVINNPSLANIPFMQFGDQNEELYQSGVRIFHVDIMDGHYVPNLCFPVSVIKEIKQRWSDVEAEVHLMVEDPFAYVEPLRASGADRVSFHADSTRFVRRALTVYLETGMCPGVVIDPSQPIHSLRPYAPYLDQVVFMSVEPGFAGQKLLPGSLEKLRELSELRKEMGLHFDIIVDGGVSYGNAVDCVCPGADMLVTNMYMRRALQRPAAVLRKR